MIVSRWYGGSHLGQTRFTQIIKVAMEALVAKGSMSPSVLDEETSASNNTIDNLLLHDSTGNLIDPNKLYGRQGVHQKKWAPYIDRATQVISSSPVVSNSITLVCGVRHARQLSQGKVQAADIKSKLEAFIKAAKSRSPKAKIILMSVLPSHENNKEVTEVNDIMTRLCDQHGVQYGDSHSSFTENEGQMNGIHPTRSSVGLIVSVVKQLIGSQVIHIPPRHHGNLARGGMDTRHQALRHHGNRGNFDKRPPRLRRTEYRPNNQTNGSRSQLSVPVVHQKQPSTAPTASDTSQQSTTPVSSVLQTAPNIPLPAIQANRYAPELAQQQQQQQLVQNIARWSPWQQGLIYPPHNMNPYNMLNHIHPWAPGSMIAGL